MADANDIRVDPVWRETPDYNLLAIALIHLAEQLQARERAAADEPVEDGGSDG